MYNGILDEYNHMIWEGRIEELKIMVLSEDGSIDFNDTDRMERTMLLQAIESTEFFEDGEVFKPQKRWLDFIEWLLKQGTNPNLPEKNLPVRYTLECESDISNQQECTYDFTDILMLLKKYGADTSKYDNLISQSIQDRLNYKWDKE